MCWSWFPIRPSISTGSSPWFFNKITSPHIESLGPRVKISKTIHPVIQYLPREFFARRIKRLTCALAQKTVDGEISLQDLSQFPFWSNKNHRMKVKTESKQLFGGSTTRLPLLLQTLLMLESIFEACGLIQLDIKWMRTNKDNPNDTWFWW